MCQIGMPMSKSKDEHKLSLEYACPYTNPISNMILKFRVKKVKVTEVMNVYDTSFYDDFVDGGGG